MVQGFENQIPIGRQSPKQFENNHLLNSFFFFLWADKELGTVGMVSQAYTPSRSFEHLAGNGEAQSASSRLGSESEVKYLFRNVVGNSRSAVAIDKSISSRVQLDIVALV